ncbi:putative iron-sulfur cluster-binding metallochaperone [Hydrogenimonas urashimensis]|uniref:putative iron-sulfur cluster-binding metallochaperone n=1 Tax=Hydrogenimonas urashimensis TaxID=2740515 RepID=UPI0019151ACF|nr:hypothetical protein [Hydrogenimonas urashimensis]
MIDKSDKKQYPTKHECRNPQQAENPVCPQCGKAAQTVPAVTLKYLLKSEAKAALETLEGFRFCKTSECGVVYFRDDIILWEDDLTVPVGIKEGTIPAMLCYCFGWSREKMADEIARTGKSHALEEIKARIKDSGCCCKILNPSGRCCLADIELALDTV